MSRFWITKECDNSLGLLGATLVPMGRGLVPKEYEAVIPSSNGISTHLSITWKKGV